MDVCTRQGWRTDGRVDARIDICTSESEMQGRRAGGRMGGAEVEGADGQVRGGRINSRAKKMADTEPVCWTTLPLVSPRGFHFGMASF